MCRLKFIVLSILLVTFLSAGNAFASMHHHHEGHGHGVKSPFEKKQEGKPLHCILNNHKHNGGFCPHSALPSASDATHRLSADCGGKAPGTTSSFSFHKDNIDNFSLFEDFNNNSVRLIPGIFSTTQQIFDSQNPPPEIL